jgi:hypothetical protein
MEWNFSKEDRRQLAARGVSGALVREQLRLQTGPAHFLHLVRPCTTGDGIHRISSEKARTYISLQEQAARAGRFQNFIPASGAATRMFQDLYHCRRHYPGLRHSELTSAASHNPAARAFLTFADHLPRFAFYEDIGRVMAGGGWSLETCRQQGLYRKIIDYLLDSDGLDYGSLPKGLLKFHAYPGECRTALAEHLVEAAHYLRDRDGICRLHFTVSPEHREGFERLFQRIEPELSSRHKVCFRVAFSIQKPSTDTLAADLEGRPWRDSDGRLVFRPGGHGALLLNLSELPGDLVYIKNIDNVAPDRLKEPSVTWKKILGGYLIYLQDRIHGWLREMDAGQDDPATLAEARNFLKEIMALQLPDRLAQWPAIQQREFLKNQLNRPLRVCGMVKNEGEPGGGPFWVQGSDGSLSLQIVEKAQADPSSPDQQAVLAAATHFNPVDLVCALRDYRGQPFNLDEFVNPEAVIVSRKSEDGRELKALERPGLWNGAMARWLTVFVEVPITTFNPVKTILDLLRPQHQA